MTYLLQPNIILESDSYKHSHAAQYPPDTEYVVSYIEARGVATDRGWRDHMLFGLQGYLIYLAANPITMEMIDEAEEYCLAHGEPFYRANWEYIVEKHQGRLPIKVTAIPEGMVVPLKNALVQIVNTDPACFWLPSFIETPMQRAVWYPSTVATQSFQIKRKLKNWLLATGGDLGHLNFMMHDFGGRGVSSHESAERGGAGHLVSFMGTDTMEALRWLRRCYGEQMAGFSVPAGEHSTITSWGRSNEVDACRNMLTTFKKPNGIISVVSDSYDIYNCCENIWGGVLRDEVIALGEIGAKLVIRPDSGDPRETLPKILDILTERFGYTLTETGHKLLPPYIGLLQGDGISEQALDGICEAVANTGYCLQNIVFGSGGALLQKLDRDTLKFAQKASAICINGEWSDVYKDPITDPGKTSKKGILAVVNDAGLIRTIRASDLDKFNSPDLLETVFVNGVVTKVQTLKEIRERAEVKT